jgi:hypothetical protein
LFEDILGICAADMSSTEEKNVLTCWGNNIHVGKKQCSDLVMRIPRVFIVNFQLQTSKLVDIRILIVFEKSAAEKNMPRNSR